MNNDTSQFLSNEDLATRYNVPLETIRKWRYTGTGPRALKIGRHVRYERSEVERWERERIAAAS